MDDDPICQQCGWRKRVDRPCGECIARQADAKELAAMGPAERMGEWLSNHLDEGEWYRARDELREIDRCMAERERAAWIERDLVLLDLEEALTAGLAECNRLRVALALMREECWLITANVTDPQEGAPEARCADACKLAGRAIAISDAAVAYEDLPHGSMYSYQELRTQDERDRLRAVAAAARAYRWASHETTQTCAGQTPWHEIATGAALDAALAALALAEHAP